MLLKDQVEILRENLPLLRNARCSLPLHGGFNAARDTYRFKHLIHPARDIAATIKQADPHGDQLPARLRGWGLDVVDEWNHPMEIQLKDLLGMIIHVYYVNLEAEQLDVGNDWGERRIVPYAKFLEAVDRLVLSSEEIGLVACSLTEKQAKRAIPTGGLLPTDTPGCGDLLHVLYSIAEWPELKATIWEAFFAGESRAIDPASNTVNDRLFLMQMRGSKSPNRIAWKMGWRRDDIYAESCMDLLLLIDMIRCYFTR